MYEFFNVADQSFYKRQQEREIYNFSVKKGKLIAQFTSKSGKVRNLPVEGIPEDFQHTLDEQKIHKLKTMFENCYFKVQRDRICVMGRVLGGWGKNVHYNFTRDIAVEILKETFGNPNFEIAELIAKACNKTDSLFTGPIPILGEPGRHFNKTDPEEFPNVSDYSINDSRVNYASIDLRSVLNKRDKRAFEVLGRGLHSLQDMFAHTEDYVDELNLPFGISFEHHSWNLEADEIREQPLRIRYTILATRLYLRYFFTGNFFLNEKEATWLKNLDLIADFSEKIEGFTQSMDPSFKIRNECLIRVPDLSWRGLSTAPRKLNGF